MNERQIDKKYYGKNNTIKSTSNINKDNTRLTLVSSDN